MSLSNGTVVYAKETIAFNVFYVDRKTMEIAVHPDSMVVIKAPVGTDFPEIRKRVLKRAGWIKRQLDYFRQFEPRTPGRSYIGGETHLYLGKQYRLKISSGDINSIKLIRGHFFVGVKGEPTSEKVKHLLEGWYAQKAAERFKERFDRNWPNFEKLVSAKPRLQLRWMRRRWGSLSKAGTLTLNPDLIRAPIECIDYVIIHELCHLQHHDHGPGFYRLLEKVMPDWEKRKHRLELTLS
jgi:predicted metal-dependent hydrolase